MGAFLALHLYANASAARGAEVYNDTTRGLQELPLTVFLEIALIVLPIVFHGVYGLFVAAVEPVVAAGAGPGRRGVAVFQRATGILLFAFLLFHLWTTRLVQIRDHESLDLFRLMQALYASLWIRVFYVAGLLSATAHLSAGLWSCADVWGLASGRRARIAAGAAAAVVFAVLSAMGLWSLASFRL